MKSIKKNNTAKYTTITVIVIVVLALGYLGTAYATQNLWPFESSETSEKTNNGGTTSTNPNEVESKNNGSTANLEDDSSANYDNQTSSPADHTPPKYEGSVEANELTGVINSSHVRDNTLKIRTTIDQHLTSGTCKLTLTKKANNAMVTKQADIVANPSSATCKGFDVPVSELGSGDWQISIEIESNGKQGKLTGDVVI